MPATPYLRQATAAIAACLALAACSTDTGRDDEPESSGASNKVVTLATHDSFSVPEETIAAFEKESGLTLEVISVGDAGELTNKLVLTKDNPVADAVYGLDNTFATRAFDAGVLAEHTPARVPASAGDFELEGEAASSLTPVDWSDVCVNVDNAWFEREGIEPPTSLEDLADPAYRDLFVAPGAATSSPGFAFLLATIGEYGEDGWQDYWQRLMDNGTRVVSGWTDAYTVDFTAGGGDGDRPIVLSYSSSPPFTIPEGEQEPSTSALLDTCFRQVEYAAVLAGSGNPDGAGELVDFLVSPELQKVLPDNMYVYPVDSEVELPALWAKWAPAAQAPISVPPADIAENRDEWIRTWRDLTSG